MSPTVCTCGWFISWMLWDTTQRCHPPVCVQQVQYIWMTVRGSTSSPSIWSCWEPSAWCWRCSPASRALKNPKTARPTRSADSAQPGTRWYPSSSSAGSFVVSLDSWAGNAEGKHDQGLWHLAHLISQHSRVENAFWLFALPGCVCLVCDSSNKNLAINKTADLSSHQSDQILTFLTVTASRNVT